MMKRWIRPDLLWGCLGVMALLLEAAVAAALTLVLIFGWH